MNPPSLRKFEKAIREFRNKEALVIDQRWNGGGNIEQNLLANSGRDRQLETAVSELMKQLQVPKRNVASND